MAQPPSIDPRHQHHTRRIRMADREVIAHGMRSQVWQDIYFYTMTLSWPKFFAAFIGFFISLNLLFAALFLLGDKAIGNLAPDNFLGAFFFSVETLATVGYGDMHPQTVYGHWVATIEIFIGMTGMALVTGVMFARFSRPRSSVVFAVHPVCHEVDGRRILMIRIANARMNVISEASARLRLLRDENSATGGNFRRIIDLKLEREQHPIFVLTWTVMHVIDDSSPLYGIDPETMQRKHAALILSVEGVDEVTNQNQRARHFYQCSDIRWNHRYKDILEIEDGAIQHIHYSRFHESEATASSAMDTIPDQAD